MTLSRLLPLAIIAILPGLPGPLAAQDTLAEVVDKSTLESWIQSQLSSTGRVVEVTGFTGALSSVAAIERITVADDTGIWLDMSGITLDWSRSALLSGQIDISEFSAKEINLLRPPVANKDLPTPEATPFSLPDLPVSIDIGTLRADRIDLGAGFLGQPIAARIEGSLSLIAGEGVIDILAERIDGAVGQFDINAAYSNQSGDLMLDLGLSEGPSGVVAKLLTLPGEPTVDFRVVGQGPLTDYSADIQLSTDGEERLSGSVTTTQIPLATADDGGTPEMAQRLGLDLRGDVTALFLPAYRDFFGPEVALRTYATRSADGALVLDDLTLQARALRIDGTAEFDPLGWPVKLDLDGYLADPTGATVLLPLTGAPTYVDSASLQIAFDASAGNRWRGRLVATGVAREGLSLPDLQIAGDGTIRAATADAPGAFTGGVVYQADGITLADPGLARAVGPRVSGQLQFGRVGGGLLEIERLTLAGPGITVDAKGTIAGVADGFRTTADLRFGAADLSRFDILSGLDLGGGGQVRIAGFFGPLDGILGGRIDGATLNLATGIAQLDPLLQGAGLIGLRLDRDTAGTRLTDLSVRTAAARIFADADITSGASRATLNAALTDIGLSVPGLSGPADLTLVAEKTELGATALDGTLSLRSDNVTLRMRQVKAGLDQPADIDLTAAITDLSRWSGLAGQSLGGRLDALVTGSGRPDARTFDFDLQATTGGLRTGSDMLDKLVAGTTTAALTARRSESGGIVLDGLRLTAPNFSLSGSLVGADGAGRAEYEARIADIGVFTPDFSGPFAGKGTATRSDGGDWSVNTTAQGPGGSTAVVAGRVGRAGALDLSAQGQLPLAFLNGTLAPRRLAGTATFDLDINGPPRLSSVSGSVATQDAALSIPTLGYSVEAITGSIRLANEQAQLDIAGRVSNGGDLRVSGPVGLTTPNTANLTVDLSEIVLRDPNIYDTTVSGQLSLTGPLAGGAAIGGDLTLGRTELQVPSTGIGALGDLPEVTHVGPSAAVRQTLERAGATGPGGTNGGNGGVSAAYLLNIVLNAPARVFIRGRGLDAELGGSLTIGGTTAAIQPRGQFDLIRGRIDILQQRFTLTEGSLTLQGDAVPYVRLLATTTASTGTLVTIAIQGRATEPEITFSSSPELPQDEVLAQLIFGRDLQSITPLQALQLAAAVGTLAGRGGAGIGSKFRDGIGVDDFDVITDEDGNAAVRAGKYLSENIYADVTVGTNGNSEINLNLDVTDNLTARGSFGNAGDTSLGIFFEKDY